MKFKLFIVLMLVSMTGFAANKSEVAQRIDVNINLRNCESFNDCKPYVMEALRLGFSSEEIEIQLRKAPQDSIEEAADKILRRIFGEQ